MKLLFAEEIEERYEQFELTKADLAVFRAKDVYVIEKHGMKPLHHVKFGDKVRPQWGDEQLTRFNIARRLEREDGDIRIVGIYKDLKEKENKRVSYKKVLDAIAENKRLLDKLLERN